MPQPSKRIERICQHCGKPFTTKPSVMPRCCSPECLAELRHANKTTSYCPVCGKEFTYYLKIPQKYCSISCGITARNLTEQNPSFHRDISGANNPMYGKGASGADNPMYGKTGEQNPAWRGGRKVRKDGYILVTAPDGHPYPIVDGPGRTGYVLEHRHVMEQHLGRYLEPTEVVHHIDGNPSNNAIDNLRLYASQSEHIKIEHPLVLR